MLLQFASSIHKLPFETRKDAQLIILNVFRYKHPSHSASEPPALHHVITKQPEIIIALCNGYDRRESAMPCGGILREALKYDAIAALILYDEPNANYRPIDLAEIDPSKPSSGKGIFWKFFEWIDKGPFEVSADAFNTFRVMHQGYYI